MAFYSYASIFLFKKEDDTYLIEQAYERSAARHDCRRNL